MEPLGPLVFIVGRIPSQVQLCLNFTILISKFLNPPNAKLIFEVLCRNSGTSVIVIYRGG